jgi:hypothetical protein
MILPTVDRESYEGKVIYRVNFEEPVDTGGPVAVEILDSPERFVQIIDYEVLFKSKSGLWLPNSECDLSDITGKTCFVFLTSLTDSPFDLTQRDPVQVIVRPKNFLGFGEYSDPSDVSRTLIVAKPHVPL